LEVYGVVCPVKLFDIPDSVTGMQVRKVIVKYLNDHPAELNESLKVLAVKALRKAFPPKQ
jgi:hypothetical protein